MIVTALCLSSLLCTDSKVGSEQWFLDRIEALPAVTMEVEDPTPFVLLANELIQLGPAKTWTLIDAFCVTAKPTYIPMNAVVGSPEEPWGKLLPVLPLLFNWKDPKELGELPGQCIPANFPISRYENGTVYIRRFFIRFERSPSSLRKALRTIDWRLYRDTTLNPTKEINLETVNAFSKALSESFESDQQQYYDFILRQTKAFHRSFPKADTYSASLAYKEVAATGGSTTVSEIGGVESRRLNFRFPL